MYTLLEISWKNYPLTFEDVMKLPSDNVYRVIYSKVVDRAREKIRKALRKNKMETTLSMIWSFKNERMWDAAFKFLGNINNYNQSLWKIATYYSIITYISSDIETERIKEVIYDIDMVVPYKNVKIRTEILNSLYKIQDCEESHICMYTDVYMKCGRYLFPN